MGLEWKNGDHEKCIVDEAAQLMDRGFTCYLEYVVPKHGHGSCRYEIDVYARKGKQEIILEVGTLSSLDKLEALRKMFPNAKIIWIHQWKNYGITNGRMELLGYYWRMDNYRQTHQSEIMHRMAQALARSEGLTP